MFDIGMWELLVVGIVALIVVGPKDLPRMFRTLGQVTGRIRGMAREFQTTMNAAARESGLDDLSRDLKSATDVARDLRNVSSPRKMGMEAMKRAGARVDGEDPDKTETPLSETETLARKRREDAEARVSAAKERAAARATVKRQSAASDTATKPADDRPATKAAARTGTTDT